MEAYYLLQKKEKHEFQVFKAFFAYLCGIKRYYNQVSSLFFQLEVHAISYQIYSQFLN